MVRSGDEIELNGPARSLNLLISDEELAGRLAEWKANPPAPKATRGYAKLYIDHVLGADKGADLDFLVGASGSVVTREVALDEPDGFLGHDLRRLGHLAPAALSAPGQERARPP